MKQVRTEWSRLVLQKQDNNFVRQFFSQLQILNKYMQQSDTAMLRINELYQKISIKHCNAFLRDLRTDDFKTTVLMLLIFDLQSLW